MKVQIIVSKCIKDHLYGERLFDEGFCTLEDALFVGNKKRANGMSVVIRTTYNEVDSEGRNYFREWRSFNGEEFKECRWNF